MNKYKVRISDGRDAIVLTIVADSFRLEKSYSGGNEYLSGIRFFNQVNGVEVESVAWVPNSYATVEQVIG